MFGQLTLPFQQIFGNFYPMEQCWDGYFSDTPTENDHGTHTMGIIGGLISETNDTIGSSLNVIG